LRLRITAPGSLLALGKGLRKFFRRGVQVATTSAGNKQGITARNGEQWEQEQATDDETAGAVHGTPPGSRQVFLETRPAKRAGSHIMSEADTTLQKIYAVTMNFFCNCLISAVSN
jgi:hypothetical protein